MSGYTWVPPKHIIAKLMEDTIMEGRWQDRLLRDEIYDFEATSEVEGSLLEEEFNRLWGDAEDTEDLSADDIAKLADAYTKKGNNDK